MGENKIIGLKTHDCHVLLQRLLPVVIRPYLQSDVVDTLVALSNFFQRLCAKELKKSEVRSLQDDIVQLGDYKKTNRNKRFPEGSITAAYISSECVTFYNTYLNDEHTGGESSGGGNQFHLSVVSNEVQPYGRLGREYRLSREELKEAHWCVLQHCDELEDYLEKHLSRQNGNEAIHKRDFPDYFPIWMMHIQQNQREFYDPELHYLAGGPLKHRAHTGCFVNWVKFMTSERDDGRITQNNGVMVEGKSHNYYEVLISVIELIYGNRMLVVLFKCKWFNTNPNVCRSTVTDHGLLSVNTNTSWYENEPFVFASMAQQVFYLDDPAMGEGWKVVQVMSHRNIWSAATLGVDEGTEPSSVPNEPYQEETPPVIPNDVDIRVNDQHVPAITGYIEVTMPEPEENDEYKDEEDEDSEEFEEDDDPEDQDYEDEYD
ncbi:PREDICTED: uncharacterized protein LOC101297410 [Fragaria vesca subsp. vesca]